ncbi:predicted protein [Nematostella vectensis]|uniref:Calmodulin-lysine N-methyltransferase n=1 Tax=Nematostella vectensis TaxID=45351 RepID=A7RJ43_NEMVE|nr:predicted protein [Nematostella vectensis]|eukprot:XP_001640680.1 predicted protein [Nematostella vectensis]
MLLVERNQLIRRHRTRTKKQTVNLQELIGFNNTGNICIWPAEEVLAYYVLHHYSEFEGKRVCELGAGMTALAGVMLASSCDVTEMLLTDGNLESVQNIDHIIEKNIECFGSTKVHSRKLIWGDDTVSCDMRNKYDVVIAADCFFHVESHESLLKTLDALLVEEGRAVMMAPCRSQTLQQFCSRASPMFDVQIIRNYDHKITEKHLKVSSSNIEDYDEDLHYPVLVILSRKKLKPDG